MSLVGVPGYDLPRLVGDGDATLPIRAARWPAMIKGPGALAQESPRWGEFGVVTTASPWAVAQPVLSTPPQAVGIVKSLERVELEALANTLAGVERVVGLGSGLAMDGAKYVAWRTGATLVQVPSTSSNNACFTRTCGCLENGRRAPLRGAPAPEQILVDPTLIARAPARLNRAGLGEVICSHTALVDWELAHRAGREVDWDSRLAERTRRELARLEQLAPAVGADDLQAFVALLEVGERFAPEFAAYPGARFNGASEHLFAWCLEERTGRRLVHGEAVCLGVLLMAHLQGNAPDWAAGVIRAGRVAVQPEEIGTSWAEVEDAVLALPAYAREVVPWHTVIDEIGADPAAGPPRLKAAFDRARAFVEALA